MKKEEVRHRTKGLITYREGGKLIVREVEDICVQWPKDPSPFDAAAVEQLRARQAERIARLRSEHGRRTESSQDGESPRSKRA